MTSQEILEKLKKRNDTGQSFLVAEGAFADTGFFKRGVIEEVIKPTEGGVFVKFYGCDYLQKGFPEKGVIEGLGLAKTMLSTLPREILNKSLVLKFSLLWLFFFQRKKFYHFANVYFGQMYRHEVQTLPLALERYNVFVREIKRAMDIVVKREVEERDFIVQFPLYGEHNPNQIAPYEYLKLVSNFMEFLGLFLEMDTAYRWPLQDGLETLNKENVKKNVVQEVKRIFELMVNRSTPAGTSVSARNKIKQFGKLFGLFLGLDSKMQKLVKDFLLELDLEKIKFDANDWYFLLDRKSYNYRGISYEKRMEEKNRIDKERGHVKLTVADIIKDGVLAGWDIKVIEDNKTK